MAIIDYWSGTADDYATRVSNLLAGDGVPQLDPTTVTSNGGGNILTVGAGSNLFYGNNRDHGRSPTPYVTPTASGSFIERLGRRAFW
jgi:hypothetical protein